MAESTVKDGTVLDKSNDGGRIRNGLLLASLSIPVGIVLWVILWNYGFMASFVAFAIAWLAVYLYKLGAKKDVSKQSAPYLLAIILVGIVLSFLGGMALDAVRFYVEGTDQSLLQAIVTADFWAFFAGNIFGNAELWSSYAVDIIIALAFGVLGCFSIVKYMFVPDKTATPAVKKA